MGLIKVVVPDATEIAFRKMAMERFGYEKGALSKAADVAFRTWSTHPTQTLVMQNPVKAIKGMLSNVKKSSVELQKEAVLLWKK